MGEIFFLTCLPSITFNLSGQTLHRQTTLKLTPPTALIHLLDQRVDLVLAVAEITALDEMLELAGPEATGGVAQLEGPEKIGGLLEIGADGIDLVDEIFDAHEAVLAQIILDKLVIGQGDPLLIDLAVATLVDEVAHRLDRGESIRNVRLHHFEHFRRRFRQPHEHAIIDL